MAKQALAGIRIVDFTWVRAGPWGTRWLGALGAEVIKIEWPPQIQGRSGGDYTTPNDVSSSDLNHCGMFNETNACKQSITVNARSAKGLDIIKRLISVADVVADNFSSGVLDDWGLGYRELRKLRPDIIYVSQSGFGHTGRNKQYTTWGPVAAAISGVTFQSGLPDTQPAGYGWSYLDDHGGLNFAMCVLTALVHRARTGEGQHVDAAQMILGVPMNGAALLDYTVNRRKSRRPGFPPGNRTAWPGTSLTNNYRCPTAVPHNAYRTRGGGHHDWCAIACFSDEEWQALVTLMGSPAWAADPKCATLMGRVEGQEEIDWRIEGWTLGLDKYEVMRLCQAAGVRAMPVQSNRDRVVEDPQLRERGFLTELDHPLLGRRGFQNAPFKMSETPAVITARGPLISEHTVPVCEDLLGLAHEELVQGYADGTFWPRNLSREMYPYIEKMLRGEKREAGSKEQEAETAGGVPIGVDLRHAPTAAVAPSTLTPNPYTLKPSLSPLSGLRVLELSDEKGQWCGKLLADQGADVIKIEPPGGAAERRVGPFYRDMPHPDRSLSFWHSNTSKRGVTLDIESEAGRQLFQRLAQNADIILETGRPGYLRSLGLGYEDIRRINPSVVYCSLTAFGQTGPWKDYIASDMVHLAAGGQMGCSGYDESDVPGAPPIAGGGGQAWYTGCHYAQIAILAAVFHRINTGEGQYIDASIHGALALTTEAMVTAYIYTNAVVNRHTGTHASHQPRSQPMQYRCKDGRWINANIREATPKNVRVLAEWTAQYGLQQDLLDPKYQDPKVVQESTDHIRQVLSAFIPHLTCAEVYHGAQQRGLAFGAINAPEDLVHDEHLYDRGFWVEVEHPELGQRFLYPGSAAIYGATPVRISRRPPLTGEHNAEVFCQELGLTPAELCALAEAGVI